MTQPATDITPSRSTRQMACTDRPIRVSRLRVTPQPTRKMCGKVHRNLSDAIGPIAASTYAPPAGCSVWNLSIYLYNPPKRAPETSARLTTRHCLLPISGLARPTPSRQDRYV